MNNFSSELSSKINNKTAKGNMLVVAFDTVYVERGKIFEGGEIGVRCGSYYKTFMHLPSVAIQTPLCASMFPWRMAVSYINNTSGLPTLYPTSFVTRVGYRNIALAERELSKSNMMCCGALEIFDAISSLLGICDVNTYYGEAALMLQNCVNGDVLARYPINRYEPFELRLLLSFIVRDIENRVDVHVIAAKLYNTFTCMLKLVIEMIFKRVKVNSIVLSGVVFKNDFMLKSIVDFLRIYNIDIYYHFSNKFEGLCNCERCRDNFNIAIN